MINPSVWSYNFSSSNRKATGIHQDRWVVRPDRFFLPIVVYDPGKAESVAWVTLEPILLRYGWHDWYGWS